MVSKRERILVLCKTYPSPSARYCETSCVAGVTESGHMIRLYPVPFRMVDDGRKFKKWQWITATIQRSSDDRRAESHRIDVDSIDLGPSVPSTNGWAQRRTWTDRLPTFSDFESMEAARQCESGPTLALLKPSRIHGLDVARVSNPDWTADERAKLLQLQGNLFAPSDRDVRLLRKLPFDFHYRYACDTPAGLKEYRHKLVDWEVGALYWNLQRAHGQGWESPFREKIERELPAKELMFLMGTIHRFPDQWLIVSLIYPPHRGPGSAIQEQLFQW